MDRHTRTFTQADIILLNSLHMGYIKSRATRLLPLFTMFPIWSGGDTSTFLNNLQNALLPTCSFTISFAMFIMCSQRKAAGKKEVGSHRAGLRLGLRRRSIGMDSGSMLSPHLFDQNSPKPKELHEVKHSDEIDDPNIRMMAEMEREGLSGDGYENFGPPEEEASGVKKPVPVVNERKRLSTKPRVKASRKPNVHAVAKTAVKPKVSEEPKKPKAVQVNMMTAEEVSLRHLDKQAAKKKAAVDETTQVDMTVELMTAEVK